MSDKLQNWYNNLSDDEKIIYKNKQLNGIKKITIEKRKEIIDSKTKKILNKYVELSWNEAYGIANAQTMKPKKYIAYSTIATHIFDHM